MRTLILMRHATAVDTHENTHDYARALTTHGRAEAQRQAAFLATQPRPSCIISSSALRTAETAAIIGSTLKQAFTLSLQPELYQASAEGYLPFLTSLPISMTGVLIIGHNPAISQLVDYLSDDNGVNLAPSGLCILQAPLALSWNELHRGSLRLHRQH